MQYIKIIAIKRIANTSVPGSDFHNYVLYRDDNGPAWHIGVEHWCTSIEDKINQIDRSLQNIQNNCINANMKISNLMDISKEIKEKENLWNA